MTTSSGTSAIHARGYNSKLGNEKMKECAGARRAPLGPRYYLPHRGWSLSKSAKNFSAVTNQSDCERSKRQFLTQKDENVTGKVTNFGRATKGTKESQPQKGTKGTKRLFKFRVFLLCAFCAFLWLNFFCLFVAQCGRTQSFLTGSTFRGEALKDRSEGCWRSGRRRSGDVGGGARSTFSSIPCRAGIL